MIYVISYLTVLFISMTIIFTVHFGITTIMECAGKQTNMFYTDKAFTVRKIIAVTNALIMVFVTYLIW